MARWTENLVIQFLEAYEKNECLWNPKIEEYKDKESRFNAIQNILNEVELKDLRTIDIKNKIKSIRTTYKRELTTVLKSTNYEPKLFWFKKADKFLRNISLSKKHSLVFTDLIKSPKSTIFEENAEGLKTTIYDGPSNTKEPYIRKISQHNVTSPPLPILNDESADPFIDDCNEINLVHPHQINFQSHNESSPLLPIKMEPSNASVTISNNAKQNRSCEYSNVDMMKEKSEENDEFQIFGRSIAAQLKKMPLYNAIICQEKIQSIVAQERLKLLCSGSEKSNSNKIIQTDASNRRLC